LNPKIIMAFKSEEYESYALHESYFKGPFERN
jgi:hypothetical protein